MAKRGTMFDRLKAGLQQAIEFEAGTRKLRVTEVSVPAPPGPFTAADVRRIREELSLSQAAFASLLQVSPRTVESWEHGLRRPSQAAARLLQFIEEPGLLRQIQKLRKRTVPVAP